jgi:hypothetical protein
MTIIYGMRFTVLRLIVSKFAALKFKELRFT